MVGHSTPGVIELEKEPYPHQGGILLDALGDVHFRFVAQDMGSQLKGKTERK